MTAHHWLPVLIIVWLLAALVGYDAVKRSDRRYRERREHARRQRELMVELSHHKPPYRGYS